MLLVDRSCPWVFTLYGRVPNGAYVIDADEKLVFRETWADSDKVEQVIDTLLQGYAEGRPKLSVGTSGLQ